MQGVCPDPDALVESCSNLPGRDECVFAADPISSYDECVNICTDILGEEYVAECVYGDINQDPTQFCCVCCK